MHNINRRINLSKDCSIALFLNTNPAKEIVIKIRPVTKGTVDCSRESSSVFNEKNCKNNKITKMITRSNINSFFIKDYLIGMKFLNI